MAEKLKKVLRTTEVYTNPNLRLEELANLIGIPGYQLSQVISLGLKTTYYEFINSYRIEKVKQMLKNEEFEDATILDIAFQSGFNSKSSFNTFFKKYTGMTPSGYRKTPAAEKSS